MCIGGPALVWWVSPTDEELFKKYNPELQKKSLARRYERQKEFDDFMTQVKADSKSSKPSTLRIHHITSHHLTSPPYPTLPYPPLRHQPQSHESRFVLSACMRLMASHQDKSHCLVRKGTRHKRVFIYTTYLHMLTWRKKQYGRYKKMPCGSGRRTSFARISSTPRKQRRARSLCGRSRGYRPVPDSYLGT